MVTFGDDDSVAFVEVADPADTTAKELPLIDWDVDEVIEEQPGLT